MFQKFSVLCWLLILLPCLASGQSLAYDVVGSLGGTNSSSAATLNYTLGEPVVTIFTSSNYSLAQGFHKGFTNSGTIYWNGSVSNDWNTNGNWSGNTVPNATDNVVIPGSTPRPYINSTGNVVNSLAFSGSNFNLLFISAGNSLTIEGDCFLPASNNFIMISSSSDNSSSNGSLIVKGTTSGDGLVIYQRYVVSDQWHLMGSPFTELKVNFFESSVERSGNKYAIAPYKNGFSSNKWDYYTDNTGTNDINLAGDYISGKGYSFKKIDDGYLEFNGKMKNDDLIAYPITDGLSSGGDKWNLISNPYPSFIAANMNASPTNSFVAVNSSSLDPTFTALYVWNPVTSTYDIINNLHSATYIAPSQAFFIKAKDGGGTIDITRDMQSHQTSVQFYRNTTDIQEITLTLTSENESKHTEIKFLEGLTNGLDVGYDAGIFGDINPDLDIFSYLVTQNEGIPIALQCLPLSHSNSTVIPIGVYGRSEDNLSFSVDTNNIPEDVNIYLEDRDVGVFTLLNSNDTNNYELSLTTDIEDVGRFYLHTTTEILSNSENDNIHKNTTIFYDKESRSIKIRDLEDGHVTISLFSTTGKQLIIQKFENKPRYSLPVPAYTSSGVYIVMLRTATNIYEKKMFIE